MTADKKLLTVANGGRGRAAPRVAPLYKRLPSGPHRLEREEVMRHQRIRIHGASPLPIPVVRGIAGGLHAALSAWVREGSAIGTSQLTEEMLEWTLRFQTPAAARMAELISARVTRTMRSGPPSGRERRAAIARDAGARERLMENALRLATVEDLRELSAPRIAEEADVSIDAFFERFASKDDCYLAALEMLAGELLRVSAGQGPG